MILPTRPPKKIKLTALGSVIALAMKEDGIEGDVRDFVVLSGGHLITHLKQFEIVSNATGQVVDPTNVDGDGAIRPRLEREVIHRRNLWKIIGSDQAKQFWRFGRRTAR